MTTKITMAALIVAVLSGALATAAEARSPDNPKIGPVPPPRGCPAGQTDVGGTCSPDNPKVGPPCRNYGGKRVCQ